MVAAQCKGQTAARWKAALGALAIAAVLGVGAAAAQGFRFSNPEPADTEQAQRSQRAREQLATPCLDRIRNQKIMVVLAEEHNGQLTAQPRELGPHVSAINQRLRQLGLRTFTPEEIRRQVAQAELDAYFKNNPDAALSASRRLAAQYVLRGVVATSAARNAVIPVNQVSVRLDFTLATAGGRTVSRASADNASYAGADVRGMALTLIEERAEEVVAQLYSDYCRNAGAR